MKKVICIIRTSTKAQEIESQKTEIVEEAKKFGYKSNQIEVIGEQGASAIKLDDAYKANLKKVYEYINNSDVEAVFAWSIDRIGRNESVLMEFKNFLIEHNVNLIIKKPSLQLLNADGSVNHGIELAFTLFATMAKQEMEMKKERFARAVKRNRETMKFQGNRVLFGYMKDENNYVVPNEEEADKVRLMFELYATEKFTIGSLLKELRERNIVDWPKDRLAKTLRNTAYIGYTNNPKRRSVRKYIPIVSEELFNKVGEILTRNTKGGDRQYKHKYFGNKIVKCGECGHNYVVSGHLYACCVHTSHNTEGWKGTHCDNIACVKVSVMDGLLWNIAYSQHTEALMAQNSEDVAKYEEDIEVLTEKRKTAEKALAKVQSKKMKVQEGYEEGIYTAEQRKARFKAIDEDAASTRDQINRYDETIKYNKKMIKRLQNKDDEVARFNEINVDMFTMDDEKAMSEIVHTYIKQVDVYSITPRRENKIVVKLYKGDEFEFRYKPYSKTGCKMFLKMNDETREYHCEEIKRNDNKITHEATE